MTPQLLPEGEKREAEGTQKYLISDPLGKKIAVAICSTPSSPDLVQRSVDRSNRAKTVLGESLGLPVLNAVLEGDFYDLSYAVFPYCEPVSTNRIRRRVQLRRMEPYLLRWLRDVTASTAVPCSDTTSGFIEPLSEIYSDNRIPGWIRQKAEAGLSQLQSKAWHPLHVLTHNDLWSDNVLYDDNGITKRSHRVRPARFVIIDWPASEISGYPIMDLIRVGRSFKISDSRLKGEFNAHCDLLNVDSDQATFHLVAGFGHILQNLENFPITMFIKLAEHCIGMTETIGA